MAATVGVPRAVTAGDADAGPVAYRSGVGCEGPPAGSGQHRPGWHGPGDPRGRHDSPAGLAVLIALVQVFGTMLAARNQPADLDLIGYALLAASGLALGGRRRGPVPTLIFVGGATLTYTVLAYPGGPTFVALIVAGVAAVKAGHRYPVWALAAAGYTAWVMLTGPTLNRALVLAGWVVGLLLIAELARVAGQQRAHAEQVHAERARVRAEQQRRQASEERLRIAQELHDVIGHHLSLINVQAGVGLHLMDSRPEQARAALGAIKQASAEALGEVRSVLATLRAADEVAPRTPALGLDRLADLTDDAGLPVRNSVVGTVRPLPPEVDRAAYRIVREALTNVRRHAGAGAAATVVVEYRPEELVVRVDDDGNGETSESSPGTGIGGMRERAQALGGSLAAGPRPDRGFRVEARLPVPPGQPAEQGEPGPPGKSGHTGPPGDSGEPGERA